MILSHKHKHVENMMFDAWNLIGIGGGSAALTWLAAGEHKQGNTLRLSLDNSGSLVSDIRFIGAAGFGLASMYVKGARTKKALKTGAAAMGLSLVLTELVRMRQSSKQLGQIKGDLPIFPKGTYGALPGPSANRTYQNAPQGAWAQR